MSYVDNLIFTKTVWMYYFTLHMENWFLEGINSPNHTPTHDRVGLQLTPKLMSVSANAGKVKERLQKCLNPCSLGRRKEPIFITNLKALKSRKKILTQPISHVPSKTFTWICLKSVNSLVRSMARCNQHGSWNQSALIPGLLYTL